MPCESGQHFFVREETLRTHESGEPVRNDPTNDHKNFVPSMKAKQRSRSNKTLVQLSQNSLKNIQRESQDTPGVASNLNKLLY